MIQLQELFAQLGVAGLIGAWGAAIAALVAALWAIGKAVHWLVKTFFPSLLIVARNIVAGAEIYGAVRELPDYIERSDHQSAVQGEQIRTLVEQMEDVHHELHLNSGKSLKDVAVRSENRFKRIEAHLGIEEDEEAVKPKPVAH